MEFTSEGRDGKNCAKLTGLSDSKAPINMLCYSAPVDVAPGQEYILSVWHRSDGGAAPSVSFMTFPEPWHRAQWDTRRVAYETCFLPPSSTWAPWTWRFRVPPGSVQLIIALRGNSKGTVWFDHAALFPARGTRLTVLEPGRITRLPDHRQLKAKIETASLDLPWRLSLLEEEGARELSTQKGTGPVDSVALQYSASQGKALLLVLENRSAGVVATEPVEAPAVAALEMVSPSYRNTLYLSTKPSTVHARLRWAMDPSLLSGVRYRIRMEGQEIISWKKADRESEFEIPFREQPQPGTLHLAADLEGLPGIKELRLELKVVPPPTSGREVILGQDHQTLVEGKAFFPCGFYGTPKDSRAQPLAKAGFNTALTLRK